MTTTIKAVSFATFFQIFEESYLQHCQIVIAANPQHALSHNILWHIPFWHQKGNYVKYISIKVYKYKYINIKVIM